MKVFKRRYKLADGTVVTSQHYYVEFTIHGAQRVRECLFEEDHDTAIEKANALYNKTLRQTKGENDEIPVMELVEDFLDYSRDNKASFSSDVTYARNLAEFWPLLEKEKGRPVLVMDITKSDLRKYDAWMVRRGMKQNSRSHQFNFMRSCFNYAVRETKRLSQKPPVDFRGLIKTGESSSQALNTRELEALLGWALKVHQKAKTRSQFYFFPYIYIVLNTAARPAEMFRMLKKHIGPGTSTLVGCKNKKGRKLPTMPNLFEFVNDYLPGGPNDYVIQTEQRKMDAFRKLATKAWSDLKIPQGVYLKHLRHSALTYLLEQGVDLHVVAEIAGHTSPATTLQHYIAARPEKLRSALEQLQGLGASEKMSEAAPNLPAVPNRTR